MVQNLDSYRNVKVGIQKVEQYNYVTQLFKSIPGKH